MFNKILKEVKKEEKGQEQPKEQTKPMRQIIIETDGTNINITKADVAGNLELIAILGSILNKLNMK